MDEVTRIMGLSDEQAQAELDEAFTHGQASKRLMPDE